MTDFDVCLSLAATKNIILVEIQETFVFVRGGQGYKCPRIVAEFFSPRFCLSHSVDRFAEQIVQNPDSKNEFKLLCSNVSASMNEVAQLNLDWFLSFSGTGEFKRS
jgi:hypothetical protein